MLFYDLCSLFSLLVPFFSSFVFLFPNLGSSLDTSSCSFFLRSGLAYFFFLPPCVWIDICLLQNFLFVADAAQEARILIFLGNQFAGDSVKLMKSRNLCGSFLWLLREERRRTQVPIFIEISLECEPGSGF